MVSHYKPQGATTVHGAMQNLRLNRTRRQWLQLMGWGTLLWAGRDYAQPQVPAPRKPWRIAQLIPLAHPSLHADARGFVAGLASAGLQPGKHVEIVHLDARGDSAVLRQMAQQVAQAPYDLVHSMATSASQAVVRAVQRKAVVFSAVTDPVFAQLVPGSSAPGRKTGTWVTGVSDMWPAEMQLRTYAAMAPAAQVWGTIYNPSESNAVIHVAHLQAAARRVGVQLIEAKVRSAAEVEPVAHELLLKAQAITMACDNTTVSRIDTLAHLCASLHVPLFSGDIASVPEGAAAAYGLDYYLVGYAAGRKAALVLKGVPVGDIPWGPMERFSFVLNRQAAREQGVVLTPEVLARADQVLPAAVRAQHTAKGG